MLISERLIIMANKRIIKLINNERTNRLLSATKACDASSTDVCAIESYDLAHCTLSSYDLCVKDYAGCTKNSIDYCGGAEGDDYYACHSYGAKDYE